MSDASHPVGRGATSSGHGRGAAHLFSVDVEESKELLPLGDGLVALAPVARLQLILNGPNGTAGRLRGELMLSMIFHVIPGLC